MHTILFTPDGIIQYMFLRRSSSNRGYCGVI